jgi:hypothetical protein
MNSRESEDSIGWVVRLKRVDKILQAEKIDVLTYFENTGLCIEMGIRRPLVVTPSNAQSFNLNSLKFLD